MPLVRSCLTRGMAQDFAKSEMTRIPLERTLDVSLEAHTTRQAAMTVYFAMPELVQVRIYDDVAK